MTLTHLLTAGSAALFLAIGCQGNVFHQLPIPADDDTTTTGCVGEPPPVSDGDWCPETWQCVDGEWQSALDNLCPSPCPEERPYDGEYCEAIGASCDYYVEEEECGDEWGYDVTMQCTGEGWTTISNHCQPEPVCPDALPLAGSDCTGWDEAYYCNYDTSCGYASAWCEYTPEGAQIWSISSQELTESCECPQAGGANECVLYEHCRWLVPGCTDNMIAAPEGCYPAEPCSADSCGLGEVCTTVGHDPCWNSVCDACGGETQVCLEEG